MYRVFYMFKSWVREAEGNANDAAKLCELLIYHAETFYHKFVAFNEIYATFPNN